MFRWIVLIGIGLWALSTCLRSPDVASPPNATRTAAFPGGPPDLSDVTRSMPRIASMDSKVFQITRGEADAWRQASREERVAVGLTWSEAFNRRGNLGLDNEARALLAAQVKHCVDRAAEDPVTRTESVAALGALCMMRIAEAYAASGR